MTEKILKRTSVYLVYFTLILPGLPCLGKNLPPAPGPQQKILTNQAHTAPGAYWLLAIALGAALVMGMILFRNRRLKAEQDCRQKLEKTIHQAQAYHRTLVNTVPDLIWSKDLQGVYLSCNKTFEMFFGAKESAIIGKTDYDFNPREISDFFRENDLKAITAGTPCINEESLTFADNGYCGIFETIKTPIYDTHGAPMGVLGIARDITDRKKAEAALKENERRYKEAQRMGHVGNWEYDLATRKFWGSDEAKRLFGLDLESQNFSTETIESCIPDRKRVHQSLMDIVERNIPYDIEFEIRPMAGPATRTLRSMAEIITDDAGKPTKVAGVIHDITQQKQAALEKKKLEAQLLRARKIESIGTLAGGIAHDFNNILYPIIGFTEMSIDELDKNHPVQENLMDILQGAKRASELVKQILLFSSQRAVEKEPLQLQPLIHEALRLLRSTFPANIEIKHDLYDGSDPVLANPTEIHEIIMNLSTNAYHAMEETGGTLTVHLSRSAPGPELNLSPGKYCCLSFSDTGAGIPSDIMDNIFDPYFTTKPLGKGSGLGLSVIHGIVKNHMGAITVDSTPGRGSVFKVFLPITPLSKTVAPRPSLSEKPGGDERILLVDDEESIVKIGIQLLERIGYSVTGTTSSIEALSLIKSSPDSFDLVITDMSMPTMLGTELAKKLLAIRPDLPIILCSGFSERITPKTAMDMGIKAFLEKPVLAQDLFSKIRNVLDLEKDG